MTQIKENNISELNSDKNNLKRELHSITVKSKRKLYNKFYGNILSIIKSDITNQINETIKEKNNKLIYLLPVNSNVLQKIMDKSFNKSKDNTIANQIKIRNTELLLLYSIRLFELDIVQDIQKWLDKEKRLTYHFKQTNKTIPLLNQNTVIAINNVNTVLKKFKVHTYKLEITIISKGK